MSSRKVLKKCEVHSHDDKIIRVERDNAEVLSGGVSPPGVGGVELGSSPNVATSRITGELCLPSESGTRTSPDRGDFAPDVD